MGKVLWFPQKINKKSFMPFILPSRPLLVEENLKVLNRRRKTRELDLNYNEWRGKFMAFSQTKPHFAQVYKSHEGRKCFHRWFPTNTFNSFTSLSPVLSPPQCFSSLPTPASIQPPSLIINEHADASQRTHKFIRSSSARLFFLFSLSRSFFPSQLTTH